ncbi:putative Histidine kinase [Azospirillaceae bacterium]
MSWRECVRHFLDHPQTISSIGKKMIELEIPENEDQRLGDLYEYQILDSAAEESFDRITRIASELLSIPIAIVSFVDQHRQWFKSIVGIEIREIPRNISLCNYTIIQGDVFVITDTSKDVRFQNNPLVTHGPQIRFYAGAPLYSRKGRPLGTLCVIDKVPRAFNDRQRQLLRDLAGLTSDAMDLRLAVKRSQVEINETKQAQAALEISEARYRGILDTAADGIITIDENGIIESMNRAAQNIFGYQETEIIGKNVSMLMPEPDRSRHDQYLRTFRQTKIAKIANIGRQVEGLRIDGSIVPLHLAVSEVKIAGKQLYTGIVSDITELKKTQFELERSEFRFNRSQIFANIGTWEWDIHAGTFFGSERIAPLFGRHPSEVMKTFFEFHDAVHPEDRLHVQETITACLKDRGGFDVEHRVIWPDGNLRWLHQRGDVVRDKGGDPVYILGVVQDITPIKVAQRALKQSEERYRAVVEDQTELLCRFTPDERLTFVNQAFAFAFGTDSKELIGHRIDSLVPVKARTHTFTPLEPTTTYECKVKLSDNNDHWQQWVERAIFDRDGNIVEYQAVGFNITDRKRAEEGMRLAKEEADKANQAKSAFLSSMSHELRTPLNAILGFSQMLEVNPREPLTSTQKSCVTHILKGGRHLLELIDQILDLARIESGHINLSIEVVSPLSVLEECLNLIRPVAAKAGITLTIADGKIPHLQILADYTRLTQVLLNLISNAVKYNRPHGSVTIMLMPVAAPRATHSTSSRVQNERTHSPSMNASQANDKPSFLRIQVSDTGFGIPEHKVSELFKPFNRLGMEGRGIEGTGIGLTITRQLVQLMNGDIGVRSVINLGTDFWVDLPLANAVVVAPSSHEQVLANTSIKHEVIGKVLYIEDNPANLALVQMFVQQVSNLEMLSAHNAELGIALAESHLPDMILMDINLPGINGVEALKRLRSHHKTHHIPVVAITANATAGDIERGLRVGFDGYLTKPIDLNQMLKTFKNHIKGLS